MAGRSPSPAAPSAEEFFLRGEGPPDSDDPEQQAQFLTSMLDALGQSGTPEYRRLREGLIDALQAFAEERSRNADEARQLLAARVLGLEAGVTEYLVACVGRLRDTLGQQGKQLKGPQAKAMEQAAAALSELIAGMEQVLQAAHSGDEGLRERGRAAMAAAQKALERLAPG